ncbi:MAG: ATP-binding protein [Bacteroidales bacterium]
MEKVWELLETESLRYTRELGVIMNLSQSIISTLDYQEVLQIISDGMSELMDIETAAMYTLEEDDSLLLSATTPPLDPGMPDSLRRADLKDHPHIGECLRRGSPVLVSDTTREDLSPAERNVVEMRLLRSLLYYPFQGKQQSLGVLILGTCNKAKEFTDHEVELGSTVANHLALALENVSLHNDLMRHKENLELLVEERTRELETANEELVGMNEELHAINEDLSAKNVLVQDQKKELEEALEHLKTMHLKLFQSEKMASLGILTAGVAHEINNPLNFIMGAYKGLEDYFSSGPGNYPEEVTLFLHSLKAGIDRASGIVSSLNQFSRDSETFEEECDLHSIMDNCLLMLHNRYKNRIEVHKEYGPEGALVPGNVGKLHQVFTNLFTNAIQAIEEKGTIRITTRTGAGEVVVSIRDSGGGIKREHLSRVTDPFFTTKAPREGTGLGLSISYQIITQHNGQLDIESEEGKGTLVLLSFPTEKG